MQRTWATGSDHDRQPLAWIAGLGDDRVRYVEDALGAVARDDATIGEWQTALLAVECIAYLRGGASDLHPAVRTWLQAKRPRVDDALCARTLAVIHRARTSRLATWWSVSLPDRYGDWIAALDHLAERLSSARRADDVAQPTPEELAELARDLDAALPHLRVALVPKLIDEAEQIATRVVAPGLTLLLYYAMPDREPCPVPAAHAAAWGRDSWQQAAARTRAVADLRIHTIEAEHHEVSIVFGSDTFTAGMAPFLDLFLDAPAPHGVLLGVPFAGGFVFHRIVDAHWREAAVDLLEHVDRLFESQEPITRELFWWRDGELTAQPYERIGDALVILGTPAFQEAIAALDPPQIS